MQLVGFNQMRQSLTCLMPLTTILDMFNAPNCRSITHHSNQYLCKEMIPMYMDK